MEMISKFLCNECGKGFEEEVLLFLHQYTTHDKTPFECEECGKNGVGQQKLYNHMKKHREEKLKIYKCHLCPFEDQNLAIFQRHAELHTVEPEKPKKSKHCEPCGKTFATENFFDHYMKVHVQDTDQVFSCTECNIKFSRKDQLVNHENSVHDEKGHRSILKTLAILKENVIDDQAKDLFETVFSTEKSLQIQCEVCNNSMAKGSLSRHMKTFHGAKGKKWECEDCGKFLQSKSRLMQHQYKHTLNALPVEGFSCKLCKYVTTAQEYLRQHTRRVHIETEGSWVCTLGKCSANPKSFINHLLLAKHQQDHKTVPCPECGKVFGAKRNMVKHMMFTKKCTGRRYQTGENHVSR